MDGISNGPQLSTDATDTKKVEVKVESTGIIGSPWFYWPIRIGLLLLITFFLIFMTRYQKLQMMRETDSDRVRAYAEIGIQTTLLDWKSDISDYDRSKCHIYRAEAYIQLDDYKRAKADVDAARKLKGALAFVDYLTIMQACEGRMRPDMALPYHKLNLIDNPHNHLVFRNYALFLASDRTKNAPKEAVEMMQKCLDLYKKGSPYGREHEEVMSGTLTEWMLIRDMAKIRAWSGDYSAATKDARHAMFVAEEEITISSDKKFEKEDKRYKRDMLIELADLHEDCLNQQKPR